MKCSEFLSRFSEFYDGDPELPDRAAFREHVESCPRCARYTQVVREGGQELRSLAGPSLRGDFRPRLQHRLYHVDDERLPAEASSATPAAAVALVAVLVAVAAWYPVLQQDDPSVDMPVIVVHEPPASDGAVSPAEDSIRTWDPSTQLIHPDFDPPAFYDRGYVSGSGGLLFPEPTNPWGDLRGGRLLQTDFR